MRARGCHSKRMPLDMRRESVQAHEVGFLQMWQVAHQPVLGAVQALNKLCDYVARVAAWLPAVRRHLQRCVDAKTGFVMLHKHHVNGTEKEACVTRTTGELTGVSQQEVRGRTADVLLLRHHREFRSRGFDDCDVHRLQ